MKIPHIQIRVTWPAQGCYAEEIKAVGGALGSVLSKQTGYRNDEPERFTLDVEHGIRMSPEDEA